MGRRRQKKSKRSKRRSTRPKKHVGREDRISSLPDDLIGRILSFTDAKDAVQTSLLSTRWRNVWKSLSHLNFKMSQFGQKTKFEDFVADFLSHRDHQSDLYVLNITSYDEELRRKILISSIGGTSYDSYYSSKVLKLPPSVFTMESLKQLSFSFCFHQNINLSKSSLNLPALTTLFFERVNFQLSENNDTNKLDFFSELPNLESLSLVDCEIIGQGVFDINSATLEVLRIKFQIMDARGEFLISAPKLSLFQYDGNKPVPITANDLTCLDTVSLDVGEFDYWFRKTLSKQELCEKVINLFHQFRDAKFVIVGSQTIRLLSWVLELLENQTCPFHEMEYLKVEDTIWSGGSGFPTGILTYLSNGSPRCTLINKSSHFASL